MSQLTDRPTDQLFREQKRKRQFSVTILASEQGNKTFLTEHTRVTHGSVSPTYDTHTHSLCICFFSFLFSSLQRKTCFNFLTAFRYYMCLLRLIFIYCVFVCIPTACRLQLFFSPSFSSMKKHLLLVFCSVFFYYYYYFKYSAPLPSFLLVACDCVYFGGVVSYPCPLSKKKKKNKLR